MLAYATLAELATYLGASAPADGQELLDLASAELDYQLYGFAFPIDDDGLPTDPVVKVAMRRAVCARVLTWIGRTGEWVDPEGNVVPVVPPFKDKDADELELDVRNLITRFVRVIG